jgi:hypothetical protein
MECCVWASGICTVATPISAKRQTEKAAQGEFDAALVALIKSPAFLLL